MTRILTVIICAVFFYSCRSISGSGKIITQTKDVDQFDAVRSSGSIDVEVKNEKTSKVTLEADDNIMRYILVAVKDGTLDIRLKPNRMYNNIHAKVYVSAPVFTRLTVSGSGSISSDDTLKDNEEIDFRITGSGDIDAMVDAPVVNADISGSGAIKLKGRTREFKSTITGSGDIKAKDLLSENTTVRITGSGTAHVYASVELISKITGSGDVYYSGKPLNITGKVQQER
jgi:hypothetical protein